MAWQNLRDDIDEEFSELSSRGTEILLELSARHERALAVRRIAARRRRLEKASTAEGRVRAAARAAARKANHEAAIEARDARRRAAYAKKTEVSRESAVEQLLVRVTAWNLRSRLVNIHQVTKITGLTRAVVEALDDIRNGTPRRKRGRPRYDIQERSLPAQAHGEGVRGGAPKKRKDHRQVRANGTAAQVDRGPEHPVRGPGDKARRLARNGLPAKTRISLTRASKIR